MCTYSWASESWRLYRSCTDCFGNNSTSFDLCSCVRRLVNKMFSCSHTHTHTQYTVQAEFYYARQLENLSVMCWVRCTPSYPLLQFSQPSTSSGHHQQHTDTTWFIDDPAIDWSKIKTNDRSAQRKIIYFGSLLFLLQSFLQNGVVAFRMQTTCSWYYMRSHNGSARG